MTRFVSPYDKTNPDVEQIKRFGDDAVPVLATYLDSEDGREWDLAMRFLGELGAENEARVRVAPHSWMPVISARTLVRSIDKF